jgi:hypothetical protein
MGSSPASSEAHKRIKKVVAGLEGVLQIKDDVLVHGVARLTKTYMRLQPRISPKLCLPKWKGTISCFFLKIKGFLLFCCWKVVQIIKNLNICPR